MDLVPYCPDDIVDAATLLGRGLSSHDIERLCRSGRLHRLVRGWFATREPKGAVDRHLLSTRAMLRHFDGRAASSHHSRLLTAGIPVWRADLSVVHLTRVADRGSRSRNGYRLHPAVAGMPHRATPLGLGVSIAGAIVQTGLLNGPMDALIAADAALHGGLVTVPEIDHALQLHAGRTGVGPVRAALAHADGRHESPGETRLGGVLRDLRIPATPQVWIQTRQGPKRVDALLDDHPVVLEFDGAVKYLSPLDLQRVAGRGDAPVENPLFVEKVREDAIRDEAYEVVRVVWTQLGDPDGIHRRIDAAVVRAARRAS
ncbi:hypothetical protein FHX52_3633 [Humibacillus xanthopallidus]|uniref:Uncharacterized protein n=1 Tax=Humibacillus xanthopallidus TaxID=412689 RepID=A0A543PS47_9MICO|nr:hypothetical protein [Humibacillus xanthopallidus]TQN46901.1 hypothetical protein FHX52_3633 [Humibacillus xanthopallidus]